MTELDLGGLFATADINATPFNRKYLGLVQKYATLTESADKLAAAAARADDSLATTGQAATKASAGLDRNVRSTRASTTATDQAAAAQERFAAIMGTIAGEDAKVQQATLRLTAAQDRLNAVRAEGTATTRQLASAQAGLIGAQRSLAAAQEAGAVSGGRFRASLAGTVKTAGELGVIVGAIEGVKKALDIGQESADFDAAMTRIETQAGATAEEVAQARTVLLSMSGRVAQSPEALATSLYHVYSATKALGYTLPQMLKATEIAAKGATVSGADLEDTTNSLTATLVSGLGSVNSMGKAMGALNAIVGAGDMKQTDLNEALSTGAFVMAKTYGVSIAQAGAALDVFGDNNVRGAHAATMLRMSVQDLVKPASDADEVLGRIHLTADSLRASLEKGGLTGALHLLKQHLDEFNVTGNQVGPFLEDAFTKRAGAGLAILLNNLDQYDQKQRKITHDSGEFGTEWDRATKTARVAFDQLGNKVDAEGVRIAGKLTPAVAAAARWIGVQLPHDIQVLAHFLGPTADMVEGKFAGAWHVAVIVLHAAGVALGDVGHFLGQHAGAVNAAAKTVLLLWAAWKGYQIAVFAAHAIADAGAFVRASYGRLTATSALTAASLQRDMLIEAKSALETQLAIERAAAVEAEAYATLVAASDDATATMISNSQNAARAAQVQATATTAALTEVELAADAAAAEVDAAGAVAAVGWKALLGPAALAVTAVTVFTTFLMGNGSAAQHSAADLDDYTASVKKSTDALSAVNIAQTNQNLASKGALTTLDQLHGGNLALGLTYRSLTDAVNGNNKQFQAVKSTLEAVFKSSGNMLGGNAALGTSAMKLLDMIESLRGGLRGQIQTQKDLDQVNKKAAPALGAAAADHAAIGAAVSNENNQTKNLIESTKKLTTAYLALVNAELGQAQSQDQFLDSLHDMKKAIDTSNGSLDQQSAKSRAAQEALLSAAAGAAQMDDGTKKANTTLLHNVESLRAAAVAAGANKGAVDKLLASLHLLPNQIRTRLLVDTNPASAAMQRLMTQINNLHPLIHVGITGGSTTPGRYIPPGSAAGGSLPEGVSTVGERGFEVAVKHGPNVAIVPNSQSPGFLAAIGARVPGFASGTSPGAQTAVTKASAALTSVSLDKSGFNWVEFAKQIAAAALTVKDAIAAGATKAQIASLQARLARDRSDGAKLERELGRSVVHGFAGLGRLVGELQTPEGNGKMAGKIASRSDIGTALGSVEAQLRHAGLPTSFINGLDAENKHILAIVASRNVAARHLAAANTALAAANKKMHTDDRSFAGAVTGSFDITSAVDPNTGRVTRGGIVAADNQAVTRARAFVTAMKKLIGLHIFPNRYLRTLLGDGPTPEALATAQALAGMPHAELLQIAKDNQQLTSLSKQLGGLGSTRLDQPAVNQAQRRVEHYQKIENKREKHLDAALEHFADRIEHKLSDLHMTASLGITKGELAVIVDTGKRQNAKQNRISLPRPGGR
ncbi:MAG TPA: phage tail tape measure protein [Frankiaceae bacterium]|nr:phage tail tape measure protein [Frankiaceae bacterium]